MTDFSLERLTGEQLRVLCGIEGVSAAGLAERLREMLEFTDRWALKRSARADRRAQLGA